jgi:hypothetical protein
VRLSIIIPISKIDKEWINLLHDLAELDETCECILVSPLPPDSKLKEIKDLINFRPQLKWITTKIEQRAYQMNLGASEARYEAIWFLHADSRVNTFVFNLYEIIKKVENNTIYYFNLKFFDSRTPLIYLNGIGVWIRSHFFKMPFGDQGLLMTKNTFLSLKKFNEDYKIGEDFFLIWKAKKSGVFIKSLNYTIVTSARKYNDNGWLNTTIGHLKFTIINSIKEFGGKKA